MMRISVRTAVREDGDAIAAFNIAMADETEEITLAREVALPGALAVFDDPKLGFYLVAEAGAAVVGSLMITYEWSDWSNAMYWWIQSVYVAPGYRRKGVYRALNDRIIEMAREDGGVRGIKLYVYEDNAGAKATYESMGMERAHHAIYEMAVWPGQSSRG